MQNFSQKLFKITLLLIPLLIPLLTPWAGFGFESIKNLSFIILVSLALGFWLFANWRKFKFQLSSIQKTSLVFIFILFASSLEGLNSYSSIFGREPYYQGLILYLYLFSLLVTSAKISLKFWFTVFSISAALVSLLAIKDWFLLNIFHYSVANYSGRVVSTFGQPNFYSGFILLTLPLAYRLGKWGYAVQIVGVVAILISQSRTAILLLPLAILFLMIAGIKNKLIIIRTVTVFLVALELLFFLSLKTSSGIFWQEIIEPYQASLQAQATPYNSVEKRFFILPIIWQLVKQNPLKGYGLENIGGSYSNYFVENNHIFFEENLSPSSTLIRLKDLAVDRSHNFTLDLLMFSGILGLLAWILLVATLIKKSHSRVILSSLLLYLIWVQFQNQSVVHLIYFWWLVGTVDC